MIQEIIECLDGTDPDVLRAQLHEYFLFVDELLMETPEEYIKGTDGMWSRNIDLTVERKVVADERDCCGFNFDCCNLAIIAAFSFGSRTSVCMTFLLSGSKASPSVVSSGGKSARYTCGGIRCNAPFTSTLTGARRSASFTCQGGGLAAGSGSAAESGCESWFAQHSKSVIRKGFSLC